MMNLKTTLLILLVGALILIGIGVVGFGQKVSEESSDVVEEAQTEDQEVVRLAGTWRSNEDFSYEVVFNENGTYQDIYGGDVLDTGEWSILEDLGQEGWEQTPDFSGALFLKKTTEEEPLYYAIISVSQDQLELMYLYGSMLTFSRVE